MKPWRSERQIVLGLAGLRLGGARWRAAHARRRL
jgi:hypothetical protein